MPRKRNGMDEPEVQLPKGIEILQNEGWGARFTRWMRHNFSSVVLPIIALIVLGSGIYLYSNQRAGVTTPSAPRAVKETGKIATTTPVKDAKKESAAVKPETKPIAQVNGKTVPAPKIKQPVIKPLTGVGTPTLLQQDGLWKLLAAKGNGVTHLAREAIRQYLASDEGKTLTLTKEQKVYVEDFMTKRTSQKRLKLGQEIEFSKDLIRTAIEKAQTLSQKQLQNLQQFSRLVPSLN